MVSQLYKKDTYTTDEPYMVGDIIEWDISKANISILLYKNAISQDQYDFLFNCDKNQREITVGLMQRKNPNINEALTSGFIEARKLFFESNRISNDQVVSIRKDAVFLINCVPEYIEFGPIRFVDKNVFTSFTSLPDGVDMYYRYDQFSNREMIEIKGISDFFLQLHKEYMLDLLKTILASAQSENAYSTLKFIQEISKLYIERKLPIEFYREFNNRSLFRSVYIIGGDRYYIESIPENIDFNKQYLDISYNYNILMHMYKIFANQYL